MKFSAKNPCLRVAANRWQTLNMNQEYEYGFWIWSNKLNPILSMLAQLAAYDLWDEEREAIKVGLIGTNDEKNAWFDCVIKGKKHSIKLNLAYDNEKGTDMIHLKIKTPMELKEKLETLNLFQSMFKELIEK